MALLVTFAALIPLFKLLRKDFKKLTAVPCVSSNIMLLRYFQQLDDSVEQLILHLHLVPCEIVNIKLSMMRGAGVLRFLL